MKKTTLRKDKISIENIGKQRFWFGIISGFVSAVAISLVFNRTREFIRLLSSLFQDLLFFEERELTFFNYFFVALSAVLGLSITIYVWMSNPIHKKKKHKFYKQQVITNTQLIFWLIIFLTAQVGHLFFYLSPITSVYDYPVDLYEDYKLIFVLTPFVIFLQSWFSVRRIYKSEKWILFSFITVLLTIFILHKTTTINQNILNNIYLKRNKKTFNFIRTTICESEKKYNIKFNEQAVKTLKQSKTHNSFSQVLEIKKYFSRDKKTPIDTIIIQKIIIHNTKARATYRYDNDSLTLRNWKYALPKDILKQITNFSSNSNETKELFKTLKEEILLVNKSKIIWETYKDFYGETRDKEKLELKVNIMLVKQLIKVRDTLITIEEYAELSKILPKIKALPTKNYN